MFWEFDLNNFQWKVTELNQYTFSHGNNVQQKYTLSIQKVKTKCILLIQGQIILWDCQRNNAIQNVDCHYNKVLHNCLDCQYTNDQMLVLI